MTQTHVRLVEFVLLSVGFGLMAVDFGVGFWSDYGRPWRRKPGSNGRWRTDFMVVVLAASLSIICLLAVAAFVWKGWYGVRTATTILLGVLTVAVYGALGFGRWERRARRGVVEKAAARTERAADRTEVASEDTRRSARRTEAAADAVIRRVDGGGR